MDDGYDVDQGHSSNIIGISSFLLCFHISRDFQDPLGPPDQPAHLDTEDHLAIMVCLGRLERRERL